MAFTAPAELAPAVKLIINRHKCTCPFIGFSLNLFDAARYISASVGFVIVSGQLVVGEGANVKGVVYTIFFVPVLEKPLFSPKAIFFVPVLEKPLFSPKASFFVPVLEKPLFSPKARLGLVPFSPPSILTTPSFPAAELVVTNSCLQSVPSQNSKRFSDVLKIKVPTVKLGFTTPAGGTVLNRYQITMYFFRFL
ncbi:hypothetical protein OBK14_01510 [Empedobacter falsenii]